MTHPKRSLITLAVGFLLAILVVFYVNRQISIHCSQSFLLYNLFSLGSLVLVFGIFLFLFAKDTDSCHRDRTALEQEIESITDSLNDAQSSLDEAVEKKTFEMSESTVR